MQTLNKTTRAILARLMDTAKANGGHTRIDNRPGLFMAACVEIIGQTRAHELVSVAHYGEQNGDAMRDPDIVIMVNASGAFPISYRNDYVGINHEAAEFDGNGAFQGYRPKMQASICECTNMLLKNIADQQGI